MKALCDFIGNFLIVLAFLLIGFSIAGYLLDWGPRLERIIDALTLIFAASAALRLAAK